MDHDRAPAYRAATRNTDFQPMFRAACFAAALAVATKLIFAVLVAHRVGAGIGIGNLWGWLPYLQFITDRPTFIRITSISTLAMALVGTCAFIVPVVRGSRRQVIAGWWCAVMSIIETLTVEYVMNRVSPPYFDARWARWTLLVLGAALAITAAWLVLDQPWRDDAAIESGTQTNTAFAGS